MMGVVKHRITPHDVNHIMPNLSCQSHVLLKTQAPRLEIHISHDTHSPLELKQPQPLLSLLDLHDERLIIIMLLTNEWHLSLSVSSHWRQRHTTPLPPRETIKTHQAQGSRGGLLDM